MKNKNKYYDPANKEDAFWSALISMLSLIAFILVSFIISLL